MSRTFYTIQCLHNVVNAAPNFKRGLSSFFKGFLCAIHALFKLLIGGRGDEIHSLKYSVEFFKGEVSCLEPKDLLWFMCAQGGHSKTGGFLWPPKDHTNCPQTISKGEGIVWKEKHRSLKNKAVSLFSPTMVIIWMLFILKILLVVKKQSQSCHSVHKTSFKVWSCWYNSNMFVAKLVWGTMEYKGSNVWLKENLDWLKLLQVFELTSNIARAATLSYIQWSLLNVCALWLIVFVSVESTDGVAYQQKGKVLKLRGLCLAFFWKRTRVSYYLKKPKLDVLPQNRSLWLCISIDYVRVKTVIWKGRGFYCEGTSWNHSKTLFTIKTVNWQSSP